jgi:hypothetical protein
MLLNDHDTQVLRALFSGRESKVRSGEPVRVPHVGAGSRAIRADEPVPEATNSGDQVDSGQYRDAIDGGSVVN